MEIKEVETKEVWENFISQIEEKTFLQSWNWGEFQKMMNNEIWRLGFFEGSDLLAISLVIKIKAKRGTFFFLPHGPLLRKDAPFSKKELLLNLIEYLRVLEKVDFIRIAPLWSRTEENKVLSKDVGFREAPIHMHPELTWQLDLTGSEQDLLMQMRKTTRYLIRQSLKNEEIEIVQSKNLEDLKIFNELYNTTASRHNFVPFSVNYLENEFRSFVGDDQIMIFLGKHRGEVLVSAIALFWQNIAFYHHGASRPSKLPISYGVQWSIIQEANKRGCTLYNFWGIADDQKSGFKKHPWWGLTLFKKGFGGYERRYLKTQDFVLSPKYCLNFLIEKIRKIKRRL